MEQVGAPDPAALLAALERHLPGSDAVILSDYAKGVLSDELLRRAVAAVRAAGKPMVADPKSIDVARYDGVTVLTPNAAEARAAAGLRCEEDEEASQAAAILLDRMPATGAVLVTRGARGMTLLETGKGPVHLPALAREVFDVSGAGDTVVATVGLALAAGLALPVATRLGNVAAGIAVSKRGTAVVSAAELSHELVASDVHATEQKIVTLAEAVAIVARWRVRGDSVGFTNGCFDLVHPGHVSQLSQARSTCDHLIVGLNTDASIARLKGPSRPIQGEAARAIVLGSLASVDLVVLFGEDTPIRLIEAIRPDVLIKGKDYTVDRIAGADVVQGYGGRIFLADIAPGHSTSDIVARLRVAG